jgi:hypothetical protein
MLDTWGQLKSLRELSIAQPAYIIIIKKKNMPWLFYLMGSPTNFEY